MLKFILGGIIAIQTVSLCFAADPKFPVSQIPDNMKKNMYAVVRDSKTEIKIVSKTKMVWHEYKAITIFNVKANRNADITVFYDKLSKVTQLRGTVYDASGNEIKRLKNSEIVDQSAVSGFSLYEDDRVKIADLRQGHYPYTVEFEYEVEYNFLFFIPSFSLYDDDEISIQKSSYEVSYPQDIAPKFKLFRIDDPVTTEVNGTQKASWEFKNIIPDKFERNSPDDVVPYIKASPTIFSYDGYEGNMDSWENFGVWINALSKGRRELPEGTKQKVNELVKEATTKEEKVKILYEYLQSKTRYVSIQLGIGGHQPFPASVVDGNGYGDCKALSNYMIALLGEVGIDANYSLIRAGDGERDILPEYVSAQFNHVIVSVPNGSDTLWLECTSQNNPFGYLGSFTGDRHALSINSSGASIVKTIEYEADNNIQSRSATVSVTASGNAKAIIQTRYSGLQYENGNLNFVLSNSYDDQKKWVLKNTDIATFDVVNFSFKDHKDKIPFADVSLELSLGRLASVSGKRLFLTPNLMNRSSYVPEKTEKRINDIVFKMGYTDFDTIKYEIPEDIYVEFLPEAIEIKSQFGEYEASFTVDQGSLVYIRKMRKNKGTFPASSYEELTDFYKRINKADNTKIVFLTKT